MTKNKANLHGNAPDKCPVVLLLVDVINDLQFPGNQELLKAMKPMAKRLKMLADKARLNGVPVIYVNDNFGKWRSDFRRQVEHCLQDEVRGQPLVELLKPGPDDYFVLKPKHSGFFASALDILLRYLQARTLIITGIAGDRCVLFTANDAFLRDYRIFVPSDCVISNTKRQNADALQLMKRVLQADIRPSAKISFAMLKREKN